MTELDRDEDKLYSTAIHESGHAVLAELLFMNPVHVTIEPTESTYGHLRRRGNWSGSAFETWKDMLVTCGGVEAQTIYGVDPFEFLEFPDLEDESTDSARLWASLLAHSEDEGQQYEWFVLASSQTRRILSNPAVWRSVESLAGRLIEARTLDRGEAAEVIEAALGRSKWNREQFEMGLRYASPPQTWIDSREEYRELHALAVHLGKDRVKELTITFAESVAKKGTAK